MIRILLGASAPGSTVQEAPELLVGGGCLGAFAIPYAAKNPHPVFQQYPKPRCGSLEGGA